MSRTAIKIAYLGNDFFGSQIQPAYRTVEGSVLCDLKTILKLSEDELDLKLASRTDKGVNALGNVAVFNSNMNDSDILLKALNAVSKGVFYRSVSNVDADFNPRYADARKYRYILPYRNNDLQLMKNCAELFKGEHDFVRFCRSEGKPTVMTLDSIDIKLQKEDALICIDFSARYYLWNLIRRITAAMVSVSLGDSSVSDVADALNGKDMTFGLARPDGLTLTDVQYNGIDFVTPSADMFDSKIEEELFKDKIRRSFYTSL